MAAVTLYRFRIELSDLDRNVYDTLDFRIAMHPSETTDYLLTRVIAFALNSSEDLEFTPGGLSDPDAAALVRPGPHGTVSLWIEIGNPSARKLHKASKAASSVRVYTYKDSRALVKEMTGAAVHRASEIAVFALSSLESLASRLERDNRWSMLYQDGLLTLSTDAWSENVELTPIALPD